MITQRQSFIDRIDRDMTTLHDRIHALLIVNIRHLRDINVSLGSSITDQLLSYFTEHLNAQLRPGDYAVHIGGDEYGIFLHDLPGDGTAELAAAKIHHSIRPALTVRGYEIPLRLNIGIATYPKHGLNADDLLCNSLVALANGRASETESTVYDSRFRSGDIDVMAMRKALRIAIDSSGLDLYYQPKINILTREVYGAEALMRWKHPEIGPVPPDIFIPIAEQSDLIEPLTFWSLNAALRQCSLCRAKWSCMSVAVNLSARILNHPHLIEIISRAMNIWGTDPGNLIIEITESAMMRDPNASLSTLQTLHETGVTISIDDFGTGYSSLSYLKKLPIRELKIDKSFVLNMHNDRSDENIVRAIVDLSHNLGVAVVAEGVENEETLDKLHAMGCDYAQGFHIARPMPSESMMDWLMRSEWIAKPACAS